MSDYARGIIDVAGLTGLPPSSVQPALKFLDVEMDEGVGSAQLVIPSGRAFLVTASKVESVLQDPNIGVPNFADSAVSCIDHIRYAITQDDVQITPTGADAYDVRTLDGPLFLVLKGTVVFSFNLSATFVADPDAYDLWVRARLYGFLLPESAADTLSEQQMRFL